MHLAINGYFLDKLTTGTGQYTYQLLRELEDLWPGELTVLLPSTVTLGDHESSRVRFHTIRTSLPRHWSKLWFEHVGVPRAAQEMGADLVHIPYLGPPLRSAVPYVVTVHDLIQLVVPELRGGVSVNLYNRLAVAGARRAVALLADSEHTRQTVMAHFNVDAEQVHRIYLGVEPRFTSAQQPGEAERLRERYQLKDPFLLYLGGLDWRKNVPFLIRAYARAQVALPLVITGEARSTKQSSFPDLRQVVQECSVAEQVRFIGWVADEDKPALYRAASLFIFPSLYEGFGLDPLEALACGTPVLCSNATSLPEVVGDAALLFDPRDEGGLANLIQQAINDPGLLTALRMNGPTQAQRFSWRRTAQETLAVYYRALGVQEPAHA